MTLFLVGALIVAIGVGILLVKWVWWLARCGGIAVYALITHAFHAIFVKGSLSRDGFLERKHEAELLELKLREAEANRAHAEQLKVEHDKIVYATLQHRRELEVSYPLADRELFDQYMSAFNTRTMAHCDKIVELIKAQHLERLEASATGQYTLTEVVAMDKVSEARQDAITATTYRHAGDLVVLVNNAVTGFNTFFVTKDPVLASRLSATIINSQLVKSVSSEVSSHDTLSRADVNEVYAQTVADLNRMRGVGGR